MTTVWQSEALSWLGIDVWQQNQPVGAVETAEIAAAPQTRVPADMPAELRSVSRPSPVPPVSDPEPAQLASVAPPGDAVVVPHATTVETTRLELRIEAPAEGALRLLAERIARAGRLPSASITVVASEQAAVQLGEQRWAFSDLVAEPARKRDLWRRLCRR